MKEIKAYVRPRLAEKVISALEVAGTEGMTVIDVSLLGKWADPERSKLSIEYCEKYCTSVKIEIISSDEQADDFVQTIIENGKTGQSGDGFISVTNVEKFVRIKEG